MIKVKVINDTTDAKLVLHEDGPSVDELEDLLTKVIKLAGFSNQHVEIYSDSVEMPPVPQVFDNVSLN